MRSSARLRTLAPWPALLSALLPALLPAPAAAQSSLPPPGRYAGELCVATGGAEANCGPAELTLRQRGTLRVQVADLAYLISFDGPRLDVVLMHGTMQIDGFAAPYQWLDRTLQFDDPDKPVRYRIRVDPGTR